MWQMRLSSTQLDGYKYLLNKDFKTVDEFLTDMRYESEETEPMRRGKSLHAMLEGVADGYESNNVKWDKESFDQHVKPDCATPGIRELKHTIYIKTDYGTAGIVAKPDLVNGVEGNDYKTCKTYDPDKYAETLQWLCYCAAFHLRKFSFVVYECYLPKGKDAYLVKSRNELPLYPYSGMVDEIRSYANGLMRFVLDHDLGEFVYQQPLKKQFGI